MKNEASKEELQKAIIKGANKLFLTNGCKKVTMDQIAQMLHISKRTIYEQFADKSALLEACIASIFDHFQSIHNCLPPAEDEMPLMMMLASVQLHGETINQHELMMKDLKAHYPELYEKYITRLRMGFAQSLGHILENDQRSGRIRKDVDPEIAAHTIVYMALIHPNDSLFQHLDEKEKNKAISDIIYSYMRGLLTMDVLDQYESRREELISTWRKRIAEHTSGKTNRCPIK